MLASFIETKSQAELLSPVLSLSLFVFLSACGVRGGRFWLWALTQEWSSFECSISRTSLIWTYFVVFSLYPSSTWQCLIWVSYQLSWRNVPSTINSNRLIFIVLNHFSLQKFWGAYRWQYSRFQSLFCDSLCSFAYPLWEWTTFSTISIRQGQVGLVNYDICPSILAQSRAHALKESIFQTWVESAENVYT